MLDVPRRDLASRERAASVFKRFSRARWKYFPKLHPSGLPGIAIFASGTGLLLGLQRWKELPIPRLPPFSHADNLLLSGLLVMLALISTFMDSRWCRPRWSLLALALLPYLGCLAREKYHTARHPSGLPICKLGRGRFSYFLGMRKSDEWRRFDKSVFATAIPSTVVPALFALIAWSLASRPVGSPERLVSVGCEIYAAIACAVLCYLTENSERRGAFSNSWHLPVWPLVILPFGLNLPGLLVLLSRLAPEASGVGSPLFSDRNFLPNFKLIFPTKRLPRARKGNIWKSAHHQQAQSVLRIKVAFLAMQAVTVGLFLPFRIFSSCLNEMIFSVASFLIFAACFQATNKMPGLEEFQPRPRHIFGWWLLTAVSITSFGLVLGSTFGRGQTEFAAVYLAAACFATIPFMTVFQAAFSSKLNYTFRETLWLLTLGTLGSLAYAAALYRPLRDPFAQLITGMGIAAFLLDLPVCLLYRRLFLEPFNIFDLGRSDLPIRLRLRLCSLMAFLLFPFGGLGNGALAVAASRRDELLRWWWETRGDKHDPL